MPTAPSWSPTLVSPPSTSMQPAVPQAQDHDALPPSTRLDEFEIIRVLGAGGFGIVYLALDHVLMRHVAIKEYMPSALASRSAGANVAVRSSKHAETFALGLESFFSEARMLASFDHPSLVKVHRFWKANGTAYMAMQYYAGQTLKDARREMLAPPDEVWLRAFVEPILGALEVLHGEGVYHRDIAPDNILLLPDGRPVLLDFGSARRVIGDRTQTLTATLKPNFSPVEQYADDPGMRQGPWTDLYALGATMHFVLTGEAPVPAVMRAVRDSMPALSGQDAAAYAGIGADFLATVDWTLAVAPENRPQSVATLQRAMRGEIRPPSIVARSESPEPRAMRRSNSTAKAAARGAPEQPAASLQSRSDSSGRFTTRATAVCSTLIAIGLLAWGGYWMRGNATTIATVAPATAAVVTTPPRIESEPASPKAYVAAVNQLPAELDRESPRPAHAQAHVDPARATSTAPAQIVAPRPRRLDEAARPTASSTRLARTSPRERCGDLNFISLAVCMSRRCREPEFQAHPQCAESRRYDEQRTRRADQ